jgi:hypothetical protein
MGRGSESAKLAFEFCLNDLKGNMGLYVCINQKRGNSSSLYGVK